MIADPIAKLARFVTGADAAGNLVGVAVVMQFGDKSHRIIVAHHGTLDLPALQAAMREASEAAPSDFPFEFL